MKYEELGRDLVVSLNSGVTTIISEEDLELVREFPNWVEIRGYIYCERWFGTDYGKCKQSVTLGRLVFMRKIGKSISTKIFVDHIDRDKKNNRRSNLRRATPSQNAANRRPGKMNSTGFCGVYEMKRLKIKKFRAYITGPNNTKEFLGYYQTAIDAAYAYDKRASEIYGEFATLNFPERFKK